MGTKIIASSQVIYKHTLTNTHIPPQTISDSLRPMVEKRKTRSQSKPREHKFKFLKPKKKKRKNEKRKKKLKKMEE